MNIYEHTYIAAPEANKKDIENIEKKIQEILNKQQICFNNKFLSKKVEVLVKGKGKKKDQYRGTTKWMQVVNFISQNPVNSFEEVNLKKISNNSISGEV